MDKPQKHVATAPAPLEPVGTSITVYLMFIYLFIITMYCLFNENVKGDQKKNIENVGYFLLVFFEILLFVFLLWKIFGTSGGDTKEKGVVLADYVEKMIGANGSPFGKYTNTVYYSAMAIAFFYFILWIVYMVKYNHSNNTEINVLLFFSILAIFTVGSVFYRRDNVPIYIILCIGIALNTVSFVLAGISSYTVSNQKSKWNKKQEHQLHIYNVLTVTILLSMLLLAALLFTKGFELIKGNPNYKMNNSIVVLLYLAVIVLSGYNIHNTNSLYLSTSSYTF
jgi:hypothetical protein